MLIARRENDNAGRENARWHGMANAIGMLVLGLQLLRPAKTFLTSPIYEVMARLAPEEAWAVTFLFIGGLRALVIWYGAKHLAAVRPLMASFCFTLVCMLLWLGLSITFFLVNPFGVASVFTLVLAAHDACNFRTVSGMAGFTRGRARYHGQPTS